MYFLNVGNAFLWQSNPIPIEMFSSFRMKCSAWEEGRKKATRKHVLNPDNKISGLTSKNSTSCLIFSQLQLFTSELQRMHVSVVDNIDIPCQE